MTIDNHPLTPKPVDDRGTGFGFAQADIACVNEVALEYFLGDINAAALIVARHREQAERGLVEAAELLRRAQAETFGGMVGGGDGGTYVVKTLSGKTLSDIRAFLARKALDTRP